VGEAGLVLEAVILAAGRGQRMEGVAKPFYKPMLEINGIPLLGYAIEYASVAGAEKVTVVVSPHNVEYVGDVVTPYSSWVEIAVQEEPLGPGHAAMIGMKKVKSNKTMLLMSDNIMDGGTVAEMANSCVVTGTNAVGTREVSLDKAGRFTRIRYNSGRGYVYVENTPVTDEDAWPSTGKAVVWCGPLVYETELAFSVFSREFSTLSSGELKIGPHLNEIMSGPTVLVDVHAMDVGIPVEYEYAKNGDKQ
jgi:CTP:molybdopterin cytidylyltransferase MocA